MADLELWLLSLTVLGLVLGFWGILLARTSRAWRLVLWGRTLFVATLLSLGATGLVAAFHRAEGLIPLGLGAGLLVVGMLWEAPGTVVESVQPFPLPDEA